MRGGYQPVICDGDGEGGEDRYDEEDVTDHECEDRQTFLTELIDIQNPNIRKTAVQFDFFNPKEGHSSYQAEIP